MVPQHPSDPPRQIARRGSSRFAWTDRGQGPCVLAVHGLPGSVRDFRWLGTSLEPRLRFVRLDMPGFGQTSVELAGPSHLERATHLLRVADHLEIDRFVVLAHSFGAIDAVTAAAEHPERIAGVALLAPLGLRPHRGFRQLPPLKLLRLGLRLPWFGDRLMARIQKASREAGFKQDSPPEIERVFACLDKVSFGDYRRLAGRLDVPVFCAWTEDDALIEPAVVEELLEVLPAGPRHRFPDGGHNLQKTHAVELGRLLGTWTRRILEGHAGGAGRPAAMASSKAIA